jgi:hypothetical protein
MEMSTNKNVESWMAALEPPVREMAEALRQLVLDAEPDLGESIKWGNPVYEKEGKVCHLAATKAYVALGFFNGVPLADSEGLLEGRGNKMRHVKVKRLSDIRTGQYAAWVREAVALNQRS